MIHVACSADHRLAGDCAVMLRSLLTTNRDQPITVHFLHDQRLAAADLDGLRVVVEGAGGTWQPHLVTPTEGQFPWTDRYGFSAWYRILLPDVLSDLDRVIYLDADLLILGSLAELWRLPLEGASIAAVTQPTLPEVLPRLRDLGLPHAGRYFNSGVMVMDLRRLREDGRVAQVAELIRSAAVDMPWADQDPLNAVLHDERLELHPRWNVMTPVFDLPARMLPWTADAIDEAKTSPAVVHFIGEFKPWHYRCHHPYRQAWFDQLAATPFAGRPIEGRTLTHVLLRPLPPRWQPRVEASVRRLAARGRRTILRRGPL